MTLITDLEYHPGNERGFLDLMIPDGDGPFPVLVCIHGGGWQDGNKEGMGIFGEWAVEMGMAAMLPNYRLTQMASHPAQQDDVLAALAWTAEHAEEYRLDMSRVGITGVSAGGHLTAQVGMLATKTDVPYTVKCIYPVCPPTDMRRFCADNPGINETIEALIGGPLEEMTEALEDVSPISHVHKNAPPCIAAHGGADGLIPCTQSEIFVEALQNVGVDARVIIVPGVDHAAVMPDIEPLEPLGGMKAFREFLMRYLLNDIK